MITLRIVLDLALLSAVMVAWWKRSIMMWWITSVLAFVLAVVCFRDRQWLMMVLNAATTVFSALNAKVMKGQSNAGPN